MTESCKGEFRRRYFFSIIDDDNVNVVDFTFMSELRKRGQILFDCFVYFYYILQTRVASSNFNLIKVI